MRAAYIEKFASSGNVKVGDLPMPTVEDQEICIAVQYAGVNPVDAKIASGLLQERIPHQFPLILGWEAAGIVHSPGGPFQKGDRVFVYCRKPVIQWGSWAEFLSVRIEHVAKCPKNLSLKEAACVPLAGLTAWQALFEKAKLKPDETVLIHGGGGGVGSFAIQWAKFSGAYVIATASSGKVDYIKKLGADEVIDYQKTSFAKEIEKNHPFGLDVVLDTIGKDTYRQSFEVLKHGGRIVSLLEQPDLGQAKKFEVTAEYLFVSPSGHELQEIGELFEKKIAIASEIQELGLDQASEALDLIRKGHTKGKIVLKIAS